MAKQKNKKNNRLGIAIIIVILIVLAIYLWPSGANGIPTPPALP
tara:strand:+ start:266 stop:397 length:132 start_codon:yes stop_codon:yes gene_type:complete